MTEEEQLYLAQRLSGMSIAIAGLMDYLATLGVGSHSAAAAHLRRLADIAAGDEFPVSKAAMLRIANHIERASGADRPLGQLVPFDDPSEPPPRDRDP